MLRALRTLLALCLTAGLAHGQVVPLPKTLQVPPGEPLVGNRVHCGVPEFRPQAEALVEALRRLGATDAELVDEAPFAVAFGTLQEPRTEMYMVTTRPGAMILSAHTPEGAARAAATALQLVEVEGSTCVWPQTTIIDGPVKRYRSFMVDLGRNPHSPETLRQVVDMLWLFKGNLLQLHLTDDQLFSWPSRAYPKLYSERAGWTWDDFVELEAYAAARGVAIVPELDVPGHSTILRREHPEVFGTTPTELASLPEAQAGVEALIDELLEVFPNTPYVHIGGDEAYGVPEDVQRDFINRLDAHVRSKGKRTVAWEGPRLGEGENKVDERVLHMAWRTVNVPAQAYLDAGYQVVNAA